MFTPGIREVPSVNNTTGAGEDNDADGVYARTSKITFAALLTFIVFVVCAYIALYVATRWDDIKRVGSYVRSKAASVSVKFVRHREPFYLPQRRSSAGGDQRQQRSQREKKPARPIPTLSWRRTRTHAAAVAFLYIRVLQTHSFLVLSIVPRASMRRDTHASMRTSTTPPLKQTFSFIHSKSSHVLYTPSKRSLA